MMVFDNMGLLTVLLVLIAFGGSMALGRTVQAKTHFIWPHDVISICLILVSATDIIYRLFAGLDALPWHPYLWAFIWLGYFGAFFLAGRKGYIHLLTVRGVMNTSMTPDEIERSKFMKKFSKKKRSRTGTHVPYIVPYQIGTIWYIRRQTNRDLLKDWIFGIKCEVETNSDLKVTQDLTVAHPWYPIPSVEVLPVELFNVKTEEVKIGRFKLKVHTVIIIVAPSGMATSMEVNMNLAAHQRDVMVVHKAESEKIKAQLEIPRIVADQYAKTVTVATLDSAPGVKIYEACKELEKLEKEEAKPSENSKMIKRIRRRAT